MSTFTIAFAIGAMVLMVISNIPETRDWYVRRFWKLFAAMVAIAATVTLLSGCATLHDPAKPETAAQEFPLHNQDPRVGLIVNSGTAPMNFVVYDQANRLIENNYLSGANRFFLQSNGQPYPQYWARKFGEGCYRIETYPFYFSMVWIAMAKVRVDLPKQAYSVCIGKNPTAYNYAGSNWGWLLQIGANIPDGSTNMPLVQFINPFSGQR